MRIKFQIQYGRFRTCSKRTMVVHIIKCSITYMITNLWKVFISITRRINDLLNYFSLHLYTLLQVFIPSCHAHRDYNNEKGQPYNNSEDVPGSHGIIALFSKPG